MDKFFKVVLTKGSTICEHYVAYANDVYYLLENMSPGTVVTVTVFPLSDINSDNVNDYLI